MQNGDQPTGQGTGDVQTGNPPADQGSTGQTGNSTGQTSGQGALGPDGKPWDQDSALRTIAQQRESEKEANRKAATLAKELAEARAKLDEHAAAQLTETERLSKQVETLTGKLDSSEAARKATAIRASVLVEAARLEIIDPEGALLMLPSVGAVELGEDGEPANVGKLLADLVKLKPYLLKPSADGAQAVTPTVKGPERIPATPRANGNGNLPTESDEQKAIRERAFSRSV